MEQIYRESMIKSMSNNELGQTISTIELLARHRMCTLDLFNLRTELTQELNERRAEEQREREIEQKSKRLKEDAKKARVERSNTLLALKEWISTDAIASSLLDTLESAGRQPSFADAKELWWECLRGIRKFIQENLV